MIKKSERYGPIKEKSYFLTKNLSHSKKITPPFNNYVMKTILSDAESREEHDETKYSPIGGMTAEFMDPLSADVGKITEKK